MKRLWWEQSNEICFIPCTCRLEDFWGKEIIYDCLHPHDLDDYSCMMEAVWAIREGLTDA